MDPEIEARDEQESTRQELDSERVRAVVDAVAAFRRLDEGEGNAGALHRPPVDGALVFGNVDAVHRIAVRRSALKGIDRVGVGETGRGERQHGIGEVVGDLRASGDGERACGGDETDDVPEH